MQANGRVNILNHNPYDRFHLHDKIPVGQSTNYCDALTGNWQKSMLSNIIGLLNYCNTSLPTIQYSYQYNTPCTFEARPFLSPNFHYSNKLL